eukprot:scaffold63559_cov75-Phaeocystis_antarctica.AAC.8
MSALVSSLSEISSATTPTSSAAEPHSERLGEIERDTKRDEEEAGVGRVLEHRVEDGRLGIGDRARVPGAAQRRVGAHAAHGYDPLAFAGRRV